MTKIDLSSEANQLSLFDSPAKSRGKRDAHEAVKYEADLLREQLEDARGKMDLTKADVARALSRNPAAIRRLLTSPGFNPELHTLIQIADSVGLKVELTKKKRPYRRKVADRPRTPTTDRAS